MSKMERELSETNERHKRDVEMLQEQLKLEKEKQGFATEGRTTISGRLMDYSHKAKYD